MDKGKSLCVFLRQLGKWLLKKDHYTNDCVVKKAGSCRSQLASEQPTELNKAESSLAQTCGIFAGPPKFGLPPKTVSGSSCFGPMPNFRFEVYLKLGEDYFDLWGVGYFG